MTTNAEDDREAKLHGTLSTIKAQRLKQIRSSAGEGNNMGLPMESGRLFVMVQAQAARSMKLYQARICGHVTSQCTGQVPNIEVHRALH